MKIEAALRRTCDLLRKSEDSDWTPWTAGEILDTLETMLEKVERGEEIDRKELRLLFLPTGAVQETAMANGWSAEIPVLAEAVDRYLGDR